MTRITGVIDQIEYLLLVMTPNALRSKVVRAEWRYGRQQGSCVIPIMAAPDLDFDDLAGWMRRTHFVNVEQKEQWDDGDFFRHLPYHFAEVARCCSTTAGCAGSSRSLASTG